MDAKFKFEDGWKLTEYGQISDSKIPETISAFSGLITAAAGAVAFSDGKSIGPGLYEFVYKSSGRLMGLRQVDLLK